jgi:tight adherence protein B
VLAIVLFAVFLATVLLIVGLFAFVNRRRLADADAVRSRLFGDAPGATQQAASSGIFKQEQLASNLSILNRLLEGKDFTAVMRAELDRAGVKQNVGTFLLIVVVSAALTGFIAARLLGPIFGAVMGGIGAFLPFFVLQQLQKRRFKKFEEQLPEAIDMLVNAMKAGYSLQAAMKFIGDEVPEPLGPEFTRFYDEQRLGIDVRQALFNLQGRVASLDLKMFVTALLIQRETGGNLAEILSNLATLMRERVALRGQVDVLTAEPKMSALVLTALPILLFVAVNFLNRDYMSTLYTTPRGRFLLAYGVISTVVGYLILRKMGDIEV